MKARVPRTSKRMMRLLLCCVLAGCASRAGPPEMAPVEEEESGGDGEATRSTTLQAAPEAEAQITGWELEMADLEAAVDVRERELRQSFSRVDCDAAFDLRDAICDLAERICGIAESHPEAMRRCDDADARCARARERVSDECGG